MDEKKAGVKQAAKIQNKTTSQRFDKESTMIGKDGDVNVIEFGTGDIEVTSGFADDPEINAGVVCFGQSIPGEIGRDMEIHGDYGCNPKSVNPQEHTRLIFNNTKSIDIVIEHLLKAKKIMLEESI